MLQGSLSECRTVGGRDNNSGKSTFVPSLSDRAKQSPGQDSSAATITDLRPRLTPWPYLRNQPIGAPYQPFVLLLSMVHVILPALVLSNCTLRYT
jgi:hypothetical protein